MKISYNWLKQYLEFSLSPEELSEILTGCGLEVEGLEKWQSVQGGLEGIIIGEVKTCARHPNADRLSITTVDVGEKDILPIVCGAPNVAAGQKVVVAKVGSILYNGDESFEIKKAKIRGELSEGMICAEDELGLGTSHDGIIVLKQDANIGTPTNEYFGIEEDYIFEIGLTPNRTDAMSHIGVARDIKAVLDNKDFVNNKSSERRLLVPSVANYKTENNSRNIDVIVENSEACPRYAGVTMSGLEVKESPDWLKNRLNAIGLRPINNIVDITNYVLHETGQPLHAFDTKEITGDKIIVKKLKEGSKFTTLDEIDRELTEHDLMICNASDGMCIGGVFGGAKSGVTEKTTNIFLESAWFDPVHIRKTSKNHDLQTDASFRFERGVDPEMTIYALKRAAILIKECAEGNISSEIKDVYPRPFEKTRIEVGWNSINRLIGKSIGEDTIKNILISLEFEIINEDKTGLELYVPSYRIDVTREADVIEEILRIYGYNNIEIPTQQISAISHSIKPDPEKIQNSISDYLNSLGFNEIINNSLTKSAFYENNDDFELKNIVSILNPLSRDLNVMRQTLLFGGLESVLYNLNRKNFDQKLFEFGKVYSIANPDEKVVINKYSETNRIGLFITGRIQKESWYTDDKLTDFYFLKAISENILKRLGIEVLELGSAESTKSYFSSGIAYAWKGITVLELGSISMNLLRLFDIKQNINYADFNWDLILDLIKQNKIRYKEIAKFPEVRRDLALLLDSNIGFAEIEKLAHQTESKLLKEVNLFDIYEGDNIEQGKKSYAVSFILLDKEKTLTDKVIDKVMNKLIRMFKDKLMAVIR